jgi:hypothetical protein
MWRCVTLVGGQVYVKELGRVLPQVNVVLPEGGPVDSFLVGGGEAGGADPRAFVWEGGRFAGCVYACG